ncbi:hypothetical protein AHF37_09248 [Paragonimus kellicotti]|nr:hypothetical protein AHF37_09248 [Paragonimus kellicotti]
MSILSLQIGQCGNQLGAEIFKTVYNDCLTQKDYQSNQKNTDYNYDSVSTFFHVCADGSLEAKCVQVDMEEKVITRLRRTTQRTNEWRFPEDNFYTAKCGSGNNWAYGFFVHASNIVEKLDGPFQRQLERCDYLDGLLVSMSLAGGTGSGVGTKLLLNLSDLIPKAPTLVQLVWPHCRGEVSVQAYNTVLTLGHALSSGGIHSLDGFIIHHNDTLHNICSTRLRASQPNCPVGLDQLNSLAAHQLAGLLQPHSIASEPEAGSTCYRRLSALLCHLCGHPDYRLLRLRCLPYFGPACREFATETWPQLARHGRQMLLTGSSVEDKLDWSVTATGVQAITRLQRTHLPLLSCYAVLRGSEADEHLRKPEDFTHDLTKGLFNTDHCSESSVANMLYSSNTLGGHSRPFLAYPRSLFIASNGGGTRLPDSVEAIANAAARGDTLASLSHVTSRAWEMFACKAYLHQYERYGLTTDMLMDCFANMEQITHCYSSLTWN